MGAGGGVLVEKRDGKSVFPGDTVSFVEMKTFRRRTAARTYLKPLRRTVKKQLKC